MRLSSSVFMLSGVATVTYTLSLHDALPISGAADVVAGVRFAREHHLPLSIRGGGHSVAGTAVCEGGLMLDLSGMKGIRVDPRSEEHTSALQSHVNLVCRLMLEKKKNLPRSS